MYIFTARVLAPSISQLRKGIAYHLEILTSTYEYHLHLSLRYAKKTYSSFSYSSMIFRYADWLRIFPMCKLGRSGNGNSGIPGVNCSALHVCTWMDGWFRFYGPFNIIGHIKPGANGGKWAKWIKRPFEHRPRPWADSNLGPLVQKSSMLTTGPGCPCVHLVYDLSSKFQNTSRVWFNHKDKYPLKLVECI